MKVDTIGQGERRVEVARQRKKAVVTSQPDVAAAVAAVAVTVV